MTEEYQCIMHNQLIFYPLFILKGNPLGVAYQHS